jgi:hypothetical protein
MRSYDENSMNLPAAYWYEIWSQVIAQTWRALTQMEEETKKPATELLSWLNSEESRPVLDPLVTAGKVPRRAVKLLSGLPAKAGEVGRKRIDWDFLREHNFVAGPEPLNFPTLYVELVEDGKKVSEASYMEKNAFRDINGWAQDLVELGGFARIMVPKPPKKEQRALALDWYVKQGFHMPFAPNNHGPFSPSKTGINASSALGFSGGRIGEESATDALNCDAAWFAVFPQIMASAWHDQDHHDRLVQTAAKKELNDSRPPGGAGDDAYKERMRALREQMIRERDALFSQFGYRRPVGLEVDFESVEAAYDEEEGWDDDVLKPTLVIRIPPPPKALGLHPIALADYRATGKAQLFTT